MNWYEHSYRRHLIDMHIDDWDPDFLSKFDPDQYFACLDAAHIQSPMIYLQSHVGLCNWDSKSGRVHRAFKGNNKIKYLIDRCHNAGMDVIAYYSLIYNNWAYETYPEWRMQRQDGSTSRSDANRGFMQGGRYGFVCPNNPGYRDFLKKQFSEFCSIYTFEGLFLDMTFWPMVCYCEACQSRYKKETGESIPDRVDWHDPKWVRFQRHRQAWIGEFAAWCTAEIKALKPDVAIEHQCSTVCHHWRFGVDEKVNAANDYVGGDLYGGFLEQSYICKIYREATRNQPFEYMTSRCDPKLSVHTTTKSLRSLMLHNFLTLAHHGAFLVIDAIDPVGTINPKVYDRIGKVFDASIPYEPFLKGDLVSEAALIMSYDSKFRADAKPDIPDRADKSQPQLQAQLGMAQILNDMRMTYTVLPENHVDRIEGKRLVLITDAPLLRDTTIKKLMHFVEQGGALYLSGMTDPKLIHSLLGLEFLGYTEETQTYIAPAPEGLSFFGEEYSARYPISYPGRQVMVKNPQNHAVLATTVLPYTKPDDASLFASIHSNPPGRNTNMPAIIRGSYGKGTVLWLAAALEKNEQTSIRNVVSEFICSLNTPMNLKSNAPPCVELTLFCTKNQYILHLVNTQDTDQPLPVGPFSVWLHTGAPVEEVLSVPNHEALDYENKNNGVQISFSDLELFDTVVIDIDSQSASLIE